MKNKILIYEAAVKEIVNLMIGRGMQQGDKLPTERELALQLNISRACIREALRVLSSNYIVKIKPGSGTYVDVLDESVVCRYRAEGFSADEAFVALKNVLEMRYLLERHGFQEAAKTITPEQLNRLYSHEANEYSTMHSMENTADTADTSRSANMELEQLILTFQHNAIITTTHGRLKATWEAYFSKLSLVALPADVRHRDHMSIIMAIAENSPKKIAKAVTLHLEGTRLAIEKLVSQ